MITETNLRKEIIDKLVPYVENDERFYLLVCDMGFGVVDNFRAKFPQRYYNMGIMEQGTVGIAAGMAMNGLIPIVYCIVNFLIFRALEQIRNDIVKQNLNVKFIGTGANNYFKFLGDSHCCGTEDKKILEIIGLKVYDPYIAITHKNSFDDLINNWITEGSPGYFRV